MNIIDTHCDTLTELFNKSQNLFSNNLHIDIKRMREFSSFSQFFACFISPENEQNAKEYAICAFENFKSELIENKEYIGLARNYEEHKALKNAGKISAFFSMENGAAIEKIEDVDFFYEMGVRVLSLCWNFDNDLASGVLGNEKRGITGFGKSVLKRMNEINMILDVSHLNEKSFYDAAEFSDKVFIATHSDSFSVCKNARNLKDEQFLEILRRDGYVGINLYPDFLSENKRCNLSDILKHIEYFLSLGGENIIGIGADFDGVEKLPEGFLGVQNLELIFNEMAKIGYSDEIIDKIAHKNCEKIIKLF